MKLIDLLVQELPKRGGWPEGYEVVSTNGYGAVWAYKTKDCTAGRELYFHSTKEGHVTKSQYESALAASKNPAWNGEGVPQVGCECECYVDEGVIHCIVVGYDFDGKAVVMRNVPARKYFSIQANSGRIKPLRSEAERKRDAAIEAMQREADEGDNWIYSEYEIIYDAIAAGKIPGVKLED